jgi:hypothetical protein
MRRTARHTADVVGSTSRARDGARRVRRLNSASSVVVLEATVVRQSIRGAGRTSDIGDGVISYAIAESAKCCGNSGLSMAVRVEWLAIASSVSEVRALH